MQQDPNTPGNPSHPQTPPQGQSDAPFVQPNPLARPASSAQQHPPFAGQPNPFAQQPSPFSAQQPAPFAQNNPLAQPFSPLPAQPDTPFAHNPLAQPPSPFPGQQPAPSAQNNPLAQPFSPPPMQPDAFAQNPSAFQGQPMPFPARQPNMPNAAYGQPMSSTTGRLEQRTSFDGFINTWWITIPKVLRSHSLLISEAWSDGLYLTANPLMAFLLPLLALPIGLIEGATHWDLLINSNISGGTLATTFTEMLPFMIITALAGALSANLGLMILLGYAIGDFIFFRFILHQLGVFIAPDTLLLTLTYPQIPQLVSYAILFFLAVMPTLSTKYLTASLNRWLKGQEPIATLLQTALAAVVEGAIVFIWSQAAPLLIRVFWGWTNASPPLAAAKYLQDYGLVVAFIAACGVVLRSWLIYRSRNIPAVAARAQRLTEAFREGDTHLSFLRRLPSTARAMLSAFGLTMFVSGFVASLLEGALLFLFIGAILIVRMAVLPRLNIWASWANILRHIPLIARLAGGSLIAFILVRALLDAYQALFSNVSSDTSSGTLRPVLLSMCISLLIMTILFPRPTSARPIARPTTYQPPLPPAQPPQPLSQQPWSIPQPQSPSQQPWPAPSPQPQQPWSAPPQQQWPTQPTQPPQQPFS